MARSESELPGGVRDILAHMPDEMRQRVLADYEERYAPFLSMLAGWKSAVQAHYAQGQDAAIARLQEHFFPLGDWRFPAQGLAVPSRPSERRIAIDNGAGFQDPAGKDWIAGGAGWIQPTTLREASWRRINGEDAFLLEADLVRADALDSVLEQGQLAFVGAPEEIIRALEACSWWVQTPDGRQRPATLARYEGYLAFEREMQTARLNQRHLDHWLPACYPYGRKFVHLRLAQDTGDRRSERPELEGLSAPQTGFRFLGILRNPARSITESLSRGQTAEPLFWLNAVPVVQAAVETFPFFPPFPRLGDQYELRMRGVPGLFAAVTCYNDSLTVPAELLRTPSKDPKATEPDVEVRFLQPPDTELTRILVKLYYGVSGPDWLAEGRSGPTSLEMEAPPMRFTLPFPAVGGVTINGPGQREEWVRAAWYQSVLRPPLLTEGDLVELIRQCARGTLGEVLRFHRATRRIAHDREDEPTHWRSYLWPSIIARSESFDPGPQGVVPAPDYVPLVQTLRIDLQPGPASAGMPEFLLADIADYLASVLSQYFVLSCFRVEARVVRQTA